MTFAEASMPAPLAFDAPAPLSEPSIPVRSQGRPLRILTFLHSFDPGGVERVAFRLNAAWRQLGADARVVVGRGEGIARHPADGAKCTVLDCPYPIGRRTQLAWAIAKLPAIIRAARPDILFCAGNTYSSVVTAMKIALGKDCPPIVAKVSNDLARADMGPLLRFGYHRWLRLQAPAIDHYVGMAQPMAREIADATGKPAPAVSIIHDPVLRDAEITRFSQIAKARHRGANGRRFLAVGRLVPQKNFGLLLDAFARGALPDDELTILGEGSERGLLAEQARRLGLGNRVRMPGHVADLAPWFADADTLLLSSDFEGVPAVIIEALAAGLGIVATNCSTSMSELLGDGRFGRLVPVRNETALADAIRAAPLAQADAAAALAHARHFSVEEGAAAYLDLMHRIVAAR